MQKVYFIDIFLPSFYRKFPGLFKEFKDLLGVNEQGGGVDSVPHSAASKERIGGELSMEIGMLIYNTL